MKLLKIDNDTITITKPLHHPDYQLIITIHPDQSNSVVDVSIEHIESKKLFSLAYVDTCRDDNELATAYIYDPTNDRDDQKRICAYANALDALIEKQLKMN